MPAEVTQVETPEQAAPSPAAAAPEASPKVEQQPPEAGATKSGEDAAPKTALEAAKRVMAKGQQASPEAKPTEGTPPKPESGKAPGEEADDANLPFKDDPRWKKMSSENRILKVAQEKNEAAIKALEPKAKTFDDLTEFLTSNNLGREDFQSALTIMQAVRNDPFKAYELLAPVMQRLESMVGARLPEDLQVKVTAGVIDMETAQELARTRGAEAVARSRAETLQQRQEREREERAQGEAEAQLNVVAEALNTAESEWARSDPDAAKLKPHLTRAVLLAGQEKPPRNAQEARALFDACLKDVRTEMQGFMPAPMPKAGLPPPGGSSVTTTPVPKSSLDAARAALGIRG